ncbi:MAG: hypothetical protein C0625_02770 [Arcobacter sp.]|nr:MAG: hypothetical protein C0625_02770 [Arcobacter sp.]
MKINIVKFLIPLIIIILLSACEKKVSHEHEVIHWDRDMCDRCKMVLSERNHAAQVINKRNGKVYKFDDIGCLALWFKEESIEWKDEAKIWVTDIKTSKWIDGRTAYYDTMNVTPMAYGFGAHEKKESILKGLEIIDFEEMSKRAVKMGR